MLIAMEAAISVCLFIFPSKMFAKLSIYGNFGLSLIKLKLLFQSFENGFVVTI